MTVETARVDPCRGCATDIAPGLLSCPGCGRLVHADMLKALSARASQAAAGGDAAGELREWRAMLPLLPSGSTQHTTVQDRVVALSRGIDVTPAAPASSARGGWTWIAPLAVIAAIASKGKLLVLGLTKASKVFSMLLSFGVYWTSFGGWFALGLIVSIYVHEMGHVAALTRYGIPASAPMFIPGVGAFVRMHQAPLTPVEDARVGLAGPIWGTAAALAAFGVARLIDSPLWLAIAHTGAWLNLFNLLPVWHLDGSRAFAALTRAQRLIAAIVLGAAWVASREGLLILLVIVAAIRAWSTAAPETGDRTALFSYASLVAVLTTLSVVAAR
jgi:Zn-dependent protease